jgi:ubiquitin
MILALYINYKEEKNSSCKLKFSMLKFRYTKKNIKQRIKKMLNTSKNFEIVYSSDCCGASVHSDADLCPTCLEHCEVIEDRIDYDDSEAVHFQAGLDFYGAA